MGSKLGGLRRVAVAAALALMVAGSSAIGTLAFSQTAVAQTASTIVVQGNRRVDSDTIRSYFQLRPGERLDANRIDEALKSLYATGLYEDVKINQVGGRIVVTVVENQTINRVAFEGNKKVKDETLLTEIQSKQRGALSRSTVQADVQRIVDVYRRQGLLNVRVDPKIIDQPSGRVDLVFEINEGEKTTVKKIIFVGNNKFSSYKLSDVITTQQSNWLSFLNNKDLYDSDRVSADQELLRRFYLKNGYADFRIISATVDLDSKEGGFVLTFTLDEGQQYKFGTIDIVSNLRDVNPDDLRRLLRTKSGGPYNAEQVEKSIEQITIELSKRGYAFAQVRPRGDRDVVNFVINVTFVVEEGSRVYVERINVRGNTRTRDNVIRREFDILEGDPYNRVMVDRAERRLKNLGYFKTVKITNEPGSAADRVVLNVDVEEQMTGEFSIGGGYSTADGMLAEVSIGERNFLGRGQAVKIGGSYGQRVRSAEFSFTEPYFLGTRMAAGFDIFTKTNLRSSYNPVDLTNTGLNLRTGLPLREDLTLGLRYSIYQRQVKIDPGYMDGCKPGIDATGGTSPPPNCYDTGVNWVVNGNPTGAPGNPNEISLAYQQLVLAGKMLTSSVGYSLVYNTLNENQNPSEGSFLSFSQDFAGVGGDVKFFKSSFDNRNYYPITDDMTGILRFQGGYITGWGGHELLVLDHFFQGPNLVRGFAPAGIGPRDMGSASYDALGATMYWGASGEVVFPFPNLSKEFGLKAAVFADVGSAWGYKGANVINGQTLNIQGDDAKIRSSVGVGLIWASPMGPLRFDYSFVLSKDSVDKTQAFRFGMGNRF